MRILRLPEVKQRIGLGRSSIYLAVRRGDLAAPISLGPRAVGWLESDIEKFIRERAVVSGRQLGPEAA